MAHIILLGDSVFDNLKYVRPEPDVVAQLSALLPDGSNASLRAVDGAVTKDVAKQLADLPEDSTHLVLSVGGNDLLGCAGEMLQKPVTISSEVFLLLARVMGVFESMYRQAVEACLTTGLPLVVCTIYNGNFADEEFQTMARVGVAAFNDVILRIASEKGLASIDLRLVCSLREDFANPIEPSAIGGDKIVRAILKTLANQTWHRVRTSDPLPSRAAL
jgi:lysophospholipase L1-like esterase